MPRTKRTTTRKRTPAQLPVKTTVVIVLISLLLAVGWRFYMKQQEKHVRASLAIDLANCKSLWTQNRFEEASITAEEIAKNYETLLTAGERNNIAICLWDGKMFGKALKQFVYAYEQQPSFTTLDNLLGCWRESKNFVLLDPVATPLMMGNLYKEAMKEDSKWSPYIRTVASSCLFQHGYYQFAAALCSVLINKELYEFEEMKYDLYQNWALSEFYNGDWEAATPKLIASSHRLVYKWNPNFLKSSTRYSYQIYNIFEGIAGLPYVKFTNISTADDLYRTIAVPVTNELHCGSTEFRYRDTYIVEYTNIQFENLGLLHKLQLTLFCLISMSNAMLWITFSPISDIAVDFYDVSPLTINSLSLVYMFMYIPMVFPASLFLDRSIPHCPGGLRWGLTVGILGSSLSAIIRALTNDFGVVWLGQFIGASVQPFILNAPPMLAANWFPMEQRTLATTICSVANPVGVALGFVMPPLIVNSDTTKFQLLMAIQAGLVSSVAILGVLLLRENPPTPPSVSSGATDRDQERIMGTILILIKDINFWILAISFGFGLGAFNTLATLLTQIVTPYQYDNIESGALGAIVVIAGLISSGIAGVIVDKFHCYKLTILSCFALATVSLIAFTALLAPDRFWIIFLCAFGIGFTMTPVLPVSLELAVEITYPLREATPSGILMCAGQLVGIVLIVEMDWLIQHDSVVWANASVTIGVAIGFLLMLFFRGTPKRIQLQNIQ